LSLVFVTIIETEVGSLDRRRFAEESAAAREDEGDGDAVGRR